MTSTFSFKLTKNIEYYTTLKTILMGCADNKMIVSLLKMAMPDKCDILDYREPHLKYFVEKCVKHNVPISCTIKNYEKMARSRMLVELTEQLRTVHGNEFINNVDKFIHRDWVRISDFLNNLKHGHKGEQHRLCVMLVKALGDKWHSTLFHNSNDDCRLLSKKMASLNIQHNFCVTREYIKRSRFENHKLTTQAFDWVGPAVNNLSTNIKNLVNMPTDVHNGFEQFATVSEDIRANFDRVGQIGVKLDDFLEKLNGMVDQVTERYQHISMVVTIVTYLAKLIALAYLVSQEQNQTPANIAALITLIVPTIGVGQLMKFSSVLQRALQSIIGIFSAKFTTQSDEDQSSIFTAFFP
jgi:hypothetical protein